MKDIKIGEYTFQWEKLCYSSDSIPYYYTYFYYGTEEKSHYKYIFFGPKIIDTVPKYAFKVDFYIDDTKLTNIFVKENIIREYNHWLELQERLEKLANNEFF